MTEQNEKYQAINNSLMTVENWDFLSAEERNAHEKLYAAKYIDDIIDLDFNVAIVVLKEFTQKRERNFDPLVSVFTGKLDKIKASVQMETDYI